MWSAIGRRIAVLMLAVAMVMGLSAHAVLSAHMELKTAAASAADMPAPGMPTSGKCDGCGDDQKAISPALCAAHCAGMVALPGTSPVFDAVPDAVPTQRAMPMGTGRAEPPDPYPPRPVVLI
jgi:hypothetical protein